MDAKDFLKEHRWNDKGLPNNNGFHLTETQLEQLMEEYHEAKVKNLGLFDVSGNSSDFYKDLMKLINRYTIKGLGKSSLVRKMKYATTSCELS